MLPPLPLAGDVTVSKDFNLSVASVDLDSPESAPPVVISGGISRTVLRVCVCVLRWRDGSRESAWEPLRYRQRTKPTGRSDQLER